LRPTATQPAGVEIIRAAAGVGALPARLAEIGRNWLSDAPVTRLSHSKLL